MNPLQQLGLDRFAANHSAEETNGMLQGLRGVLLRTHPDAAKTNSATGFATIADALTVLSDSEAFEDAVIQSGRGQRYQHEITKLRSDTLDRLEAIQRSSAGIVDLLTADVLHDPFSLFAERSVKLEVLELSAAWRSDTRDESGLGDFESSNKQLLKTSYNQKFKLDGLGRDVKKKYGFNVTLRDGAVHFSDTEKSDTAVALLRFDMSVLENYLPRLTDSSERIGAKKDLDWAYTVYNVKDLADLLRRTHSVSTRFNLEESTHQVLLVHTAKSNSFSLLGIIIGVSVEAEGA